MLGVAPVFGNMLTLSSFFAGGSWPSLMLCTSVVGCASLAAAGVGKVRCETDFGTPGFGPSAGPFVDNDFLALAARPCDCCEGKVFRLCGVALPFACLGLACRSGEVLNDGSAGGC